MIGSLVVLPVIAFRQSAAMYVRTGGVPKNGVLTFIVVLVGKGFSRSAGCHFTGTQHALARGHRVLPCVRVTVCLCP